MDPGRGDASIYNDGSISAPGDRTDRSMEQAVVTATSAAGKDYIKWVDFTVSYEALCQAYDWDVDTFDTEHHVEWIPLLAYTAARTGGEFDKKGAEDPERDGGEAG